MLSQTSCSHFSQLYIIFGWLCNNPDMASNLTEFDECEIDGNISMHSPATDTVHTLWSALWDGVYDLTCSMRSGDRRSDGGGVPAVKQASRPSDRVRRDRFSPPSSHHVSSTSSQAEWKPPPTGDRSRSGQTKGDSIFLPQHGWYSVVSVWDVCDKVSAKLY